MFVRFDILQLIFDWWFYFCLKNNSFIWLIEIYSLEILLYIYGILINISGYKQLFSAHTYPYFCFFLIFIKKGIILLHSYCYHSFLIIIFISLNGSFTTFIFIFLIESYYQNKNVIYDEMNLYIPFLLLI